ncbi:glycerol uptake facilitator protein [Chitinophaga sp. CF118]|uniref:MIP/aquaporin family protein n=1 Tax=Chitinophaga sp. CF118 TaxID=1884367 RepID=UPI0008E53F05|nr:MIP/aquaporin family protein [Chitinophaga sp. CF118]SFD48792.1 glycerol uptake facilitator protein [Chitinophaga sp. CF118]
MTPFIAEIIGTALLILLGNGVVANVVLKDTKGNSGGWIVITTAWAFAVFVGVVVAGPYSGAHLNPAVTLALAIAGKFPWADVPTYIAGEFIGAMIGAFFVWLTYKDHFDRTEDGGTKMAAFCTAPAIRNTGINFINEVVGTFVLIISILYITGAEITPTHQPVGMGSIGALPVSIVVWVIGLSLGGTTGYAINPARDLGPRIIHALLPIKAQKAGSDWGYAWIPVLGPILGASLAAVVFLSLK